MTAAAVEPGLRHRHREAARLSVGRHGVVYLIVALGALLLSAGHMYSLAASWEDHSFRLVLAAFAAFTVGGVLVAVAQFAHMMVWRRSLAVIPLAVGVSALLLPVLAFWSGH